MKSVFSLSFLRPIYKAVMKGSLVVVLVQPSRQGGNRWNVMLSEIWEIREFLIKAKKWHQAIISYSIIDQPVWRDMPYGYIPDKDGKLRKGAY